MGGARTWRRRRRPGGNFIAVTGRESARFLYSSLKWFGNDIYNTYETEYFSSTFWGFAKKKLTYSKISFYPCFFFSSPDLREAQHTRLAAGFPQWHRTRVSRVNFKPNTTEHLRRNPFTLRTQEPRISQTLFHCNGLSWTRSGILQARAQLPDITALCVSLAGFTSHLSFSRTYLKKMGVRDAGRVCSQFAQRTDCTLLTADPHALASPERWLVQTCHVLPPLPALWLAEDWHVTHHQLPK